jgi:hypothetical protein
LVLPGEAVKVVPWVGLGEIGTVGVISTVGVPAGGDESVTTAVG